MVSSSAAFADNLTQTWYQGPSLPTSYTARWDFGAAVLPPQGKVVVFGGAPAQQGQSWYNDTWIYTDSTGTWAAGPAAPSGLTPRSGMAMAYDDAIGKIVLFGGQNPGVWPPYNETWLFDGTKWTQGPAAPANLGGRIGAQMVYDPDIGKLVLFGGAGAGVYNDTWLFDGTTWTQGPAAASGMLARVFFGMTYDAGLKKIVVAGGSGDSKVWYFDGTKWTSGPSLPSTMTTTERLRMAYDPFMKGDLIYGGIGPGHDTNTLWMLSNGAWASVNVPKTKPSARIDGAMLWDPTKQAFMLIGGEDPASDGKTALKDTWFVLCPPTTLTPNTGPKGTKVTLKSGPGWPAGTVVTLTFGENTSLGTATADSGGMVNTTFNVPSNAGLGAKTVTVANTTLVLKSQATFTVTGMADPHGTAPSDGHSGNGQVATSQTPIVATSASAGPRFSQTPAAATGQVSAKNGQFWLGSKVVVLRGIDLYPMTPIATDFTTIGSTWKMNFVRFQIHWADFEIKAPVKVGGTWTHTYDANATATLIAAIQNATAAGLYVEVENGLPSLWPCWLRQPAYNSHGKSYSCTIGQGNDSFDTDFWTDSLVQQFDSDFLKYLAGVVKPLDGVVGYEPMDEPHPGTLDMTQSANLTLVLNVEYAMCQAVRGVDPSRVIFWTTYLSLGDAIGKIDLSQWKTMSNTAFDLHDYWGGRWGNAFTTDTTDPKYKYINGTLEDFTINTAIPPYLGNSLSQQRYMQYFFTYLGSPGAAGAIPLVIGEFTGNVDTGEPNMAGLMGTMTWAFNSLGISWNVWSYNEGNDVFQPNGQTYPWFNIVLSAVGQVRT